MKTPFWVPVFALLIPITIQAAPREKISVTCEELPETVSERCAKLRANGNAYGPLREELRELAVRRTPVGTVNEAIVQQVTPTLLRSGRLGPNLSKNQKAFEELKALGVNLVLDLSGEDGNFVSENGIAVNSSFALRDGGYSFEKKEILTLWNALARVLENEKAGGKTLIHCQAGIGRTGSLVTLYRVFKMGWRLEEVALELFAQDGAHYPDVVRILALALKGEDLDAIEILTDLGEFEWLDGMPKDDPLFSAYLQGDWPRMEAHLDSNPSLAYVSYPIVLRTYFQNAKGEVKRTEKSVRFSPFLSYYAGDTFFSQGMPREPGRTDKAMERFDRIPPSREFLQNEYFFRFTGFNSLTKQSSLRSAMGAFKSATSTNSSTGRADRWLVWEKTIKVFPFSELGPLTPRVGPGIPEFLKWTEEYLLSLTKEEQRDRLIDWGMNAPGQGPGPRGILKFSNHFGLKVGFSQSEVDAIIVEVQTRMKRPIEELAESEVLSGNY